MGTQITMKDIAGMAGVSRQAVSAVLNNAKNVRISAEKTAKILALVKELHFTPNRAARLLKGGTTRLIGVISSSNCSSTSLFLHMEIAQLLQLRGYGVLSSHLYEYDRETFAGRIAELKSRAVDGIVVLDSPEYFHQPGDAVTPLVYCSHGNFGGSDVCADLVVGGYLAAKHLFGHGRKRLMYLSASDSRGDQRKRAGVRRALVENGQAADDMELLCTQGMGDYRQVVERLLELGADGVVCCNDFFAMHLVDALSRYGRRVPEDVAVIGFDGYKYCDLAPVPLTTMVQPLHDEAEMAIKLLFERMERREGDSPLANMKIPPRLRCSASCGCVATSEPRPFVRSCPMMLGDDLQINAED